MKLRFCRAQVLSGSGFVGLQVLSGSGLSSSGFVGRRFCHDTSSSATRDLYADTYVPRLV